MKLLGILGNAGSGKDTLADWLVEHHRFVKVAIADKLKRDIRDMFGMEMEPLWGPSELRGQPDPRYTMTNGEVLTPRVATQRLGDFYRDLCSKSVMGYVERVIFELRSHPENTKYHAHEGLLPTFSHFWKGYKGIVVPDLRLAEEVDLIHTLGGKVVRTYREGATGNVGIAGHKTEQQGSIPDSACDKVLRVREGLNGFYAQLASELGDWLM